jgi:signal transduction histidine kinase
MGYAPWLGHVFSNLLGNAVKYIGKDNPSPRIAIQGAVNERVARFEVEDNGLGISSNDQGALFDKFSRFHKAEAPGSGLGLTIVDMIIHRLGGKLGVTSEPGRGSTFWFELPAAPPIEAQGLETTSQAEEVPSTD